MNNKRMSVKERNLLKGAIRRVFSRSDLRRSAVEVSRVEHKDENRPRVTKWSKCPVCKEFTPTYKMEVDHIEPIIPLNSSLEDMSWDEVVNRTWCDNKGLVALCKLCHIIKTKAENKIRREHKKKNKGSKR